MMQMVGIQFYENDPRKSMAVKVRAAQELHVQKTGMKAQICLVSIKNAEGIDFEAVSKECSVIVRPARILPIHHLWIGIEQEAPS